MSVIQMIYDDISCICNCKDFNAMECISEEDAPHKGCKNYVSGKPYYLNHCGVNVLVSGDESCKNCFTKTRIKSVETNVYEIENLSDYDNWFGYMLVTIKKTKYLCREVRIDEKLIFKDGKCYNLLAEEKA